MKRGGTLGGIRTMITAAWRYRGFVISSISTDLHTRFARSKLGGLWMIIHPLVQVAIFAFILSTMLSARLPGIDNQYAYAIYLIAGTLAWSLFAEIVTRCVTIFIDNGNLMKKIVFPRITLPLIVTGGAILNNILLFLAALIIFATLGHYPPLQILWLPVLMGITIMLGLGLGLVLGVLNVFIRDVGQVVPVALQIGFWFTPIVYMPSIVPESVRGLLTFNPMWHVVRAYHDVLVFGVTPGWPVLLTIALVGLLLLGLSLILFRKAAPEMVDVL